MQRSLEIALLCSDDTAFVTGQTINVDRGLNFHGGESALYCVLPNLVDN